MVSHVSCAAAMSFFGSIAARLSESISISGSGYFTRRIFEQFLAFHITTGSIHLTATAVTSFFGRMAAGLPEGISISGTGYFALSSIWLIFISALTFTGFQSFALGLIAAHMLHWQLRQYHLLLDILDILPQGFRSGTKWESALEAPRRYLWPLAVVGAKGPEPLASALARCWELSTSSLQWYPSAMWAWTCAGFALHATRHILVTVMLMHMTPDIAMHEVLCLADALRKRASKVLKRASKAFILGLSQHTCCTDIAAATAGG